VDRKELKDRLVAAGVPESSYFIVGIDSQQTPGKGGGFGELVLTRADDAGCRLVTEERGQVQRDQRFGTEDEACEAAWQELRPWNQTIRQRSPQERERALERSRRAQAEGGVTPAQ
jgi:hypothetical protein